MANLLLTLVTLCAFVGAARCLHSPARLLHDEVLNVTSFPMGGHTHNIVNWTLPLGGEHMHGSPGDMFEFDAKGPCDLYRFPDENSYEQCNFSNATFVTNLTAASVPPYSYSLTLQPTPDILYFGSKSCAGGSVSSKVAVTGTACDDGLKAHIHVASSETASPAMSSPPPPLSAAGVAPALWLCLLCALLVFISL